MAAAHGLESHLDGDQASMVLMKPDTGDKYTKSDSILQILRLLGGWWRILLIFSILPASFRDWVYSLIARNRRKFFGVQDSVCELPDERVRSRLID